MTRTERLTAIFAFLVVAASVSLHWIFWRSAGALWRDELGTVRIAAYPTFAQWRDHLQFETFGLTWQCLLRFWIFVAGGSIPSFRLFGFLIGLAILAAIFFAARLTEPTIPLVALAIVGTNAAFIRSGDSIRGYGLSVVVGIVMLALLQRALTLQTRQAWIWAASVAILAVHTSYYNSVLLLACGIAGALDSGRHWWKPMLAGAIAAATIVPYWQATRARRLWDELEKVNVSFPLWLRTGMDALRSSGGLAALLCVAAILAGIVLALRLRTHRFLLLVMILFPALHFLFLRAVGYFPRPWYYALLLSVLAFCADRLLPANARLAAILIVVCAVPLAARVVSERQSNADEAASLIATEGTAGDFVVVYPWYCGASFTQYYSGAAPWTTLPPLEDISVHRYDLFQRALRDPHATDPVIAGVTKALRSGHHVWLVGFPLFTDRPSPPGQPRDEFEAADFRWSATLHDTLKREASTATRRLAPGDDVSIYERMIVTEFSR